MFSITKKKTTNLGERLYPLIAAKYSDPGKITGMLLELENDEILKMIVDPKYLTERAAEATRVLNEYLVSCAI